MKSAGKARSNGLYRHIRTSKEIIRNLLNDYHKITGKIPEQRVSPVQPLCVLQRGMQKFMCQNKPPFLCAQSGIRIDIDFCHTAGDRRNADAEP